MEDEIINLGVFEFDTQRLEASYESITAKMQALKVEQNAYRESTKELDKQIQSLKTSNEELAASGQKNSEAYQENSKQIEKLNEQQLNNFRASEGLSRQMKTLGSELKAVTTQMDAYTDAEGKAVTITDKFNKAMGAEITSVNSARAANKELLALRNSLNSAIPEQAAMIAKLNTQYDENIAYIDASVSAYEQQKMNIGNYTESIVEAYRAIEKEKKELEELNKELKKQRDETEKGSDEWKILNQQMIQNNTQINILSNDMARATGEFGDLSDVLKLTNGGLGGFMDAATGAGGAGNLLTTVGKGVIQAVMGITQASLAFIATPIGAIIAALVLAFTLVKNAMNRSEEATNKITRIFSVFSGLISKVLSVLEPVGEFLIDGLVKGFEWLAKAAEEAMEMIAKGLEFIGMDEAAASVREFSNEVKETAKSALALADAEAELVKMQRQARLTQLEYQKEAEKLRQQRDDETKSIHERIRLNDQLGAVLQKQLADEMKIAQQRLKVVNMKIEQDGRSTELLDQQAEALVEIADIEERITGQQSEQIKERGNLLRDYNNQVREAQRKRLDEAIKSMELELTRFQLVNDKAGNDLEKRQKLAEGIYQRELAIYKKQLDNKLISQDEYQTKALESATEYGDALVEATIDAADLELEAIRQANQIKIDENKYYNDELYFQDLDRLAKVEQAEKDALKLRLDNQLINEKEYQIALKEIQDGFQSERDALFEEREDAQKTKEEEDLLLRREVEQQNLDYDLQAQLDNFDKGYAARKAAAIKNGVDLELFEKAEAERRKGIEKSVLDNKLQLAGATFSALSTIFGEQSKAGKALGVMQATIDTYRAANVALASAPPPFNYVLAAGAVASGLANVKKIVGTKEPAPPKASYARGVIGLGGMGTTTSDSIDARLSLGESVMTAQTTSMFPNTLTAMNALGGGDGIADNATVQAGLLQDMNGASLGEMIAEAVAVGAERGTQIGSQTGIENLSDNRNIMRNAEF